MKKIVIGLILISGLFSTPLSAQNVGIGNPTPTEKFHVDSGNIKIGKYIWDPSRSHLLKFGDGDYVHVGEVGDDSLELQARHFNFKSISGNTKVTLNGTLQLLTGAEAAGKVLTSSSDGSANWQTPLPPADNTGFYVMRSSGIQTITASPSFNKIIFPSIGFNDGTVWSSVFNEYSAPATGVYHFDTRVYFSTAAFSGTKTFVVAICVNGSPVQRQDIVETYTSLSGYRTEYQLSGLLKCNITDKVSVQLFTDSGVDTYIQYYGTAFSGYRVY